MQRWVRGHQARRWCRVQRRLERKAAVAIQRVWRGVRCRRTVQPGLRTKARQRHAAAVTVQKYMRRWLTRRRVRRLLVSGCWVGAKGLVGVGLPGRTFHSSEGNAAYCERRGIVRDMLRGERRGVYSELAQPLPRQTLRLGLGFFAGEPRVLTLILTLNLPLTQVCRLLAAVDVQRYMRGWLARRRVKRLWESEMLEWANRAATTVQRYVRGSQVCVCVRCSRPAHTLREPCAERPHTRRTRRRYVLFGRTVRHTGRSSRTVSGMTLYRSVGRAACARWVHAIR